MKTYVISLERATRRRKYIFNHCNELEIKYQIVDAIDGDLLTQHQIEENCDIEEVNKYRWWLTDGAIGCALSHLKAYQEFLKTNDKFAFVIEDDVVLPKNIEQILTEIEANIHVNEIVLLYYTSFRQAKFSTVNKISLTGSDLCFPMDIKQPICASAYVIGRQVAINLTNKIIPIKVTADSWGYYYDQGCFDSLRIQFPMTVKTKNFKSSIDYFGKNSWKSKMSSFVDKYKFPIFYQLFAFRRKQNLRKMLNRFESTNEPSPIIKMLTMLMAVIVFA